MNRFTFKMFGRTLLMLTAMLAVGLSGCGGDDNPNNNGGGTDTTGGNNNGGGSVPIGKWMKENLNEKTADSWCYGEGGQVYVDGEYRTLSSSEIQANCAKYGRLYTWEAAKRACQSVGMRLPTREEWGALVTAAGGVGTAGKKLKSKSGWNDYDGKSGNGTDDYGFSALPGGYRESDGSFHGAGGNGFWWAATESGGSYAYGRFMNYDDDLAFEYNYEKSGGYSVRCVSD